MKKCFSCKEEKTFDLSFKSKNTSDGLHSWCKVCCTKGNVLSREKLNSTIQGRAKVFLQNARKSANKRNQEFELTIQDIVNCWNDQLGICAYSGRKMKLEAGHLETVSIERIDNKVGYTVKNTILVCQAINRMKSNFEFNEFFDLCKDVALFLSDDDIKISVGAFK